MAFKFNPHTIDEVNCVLNNLTENAGKVGEKGWINYQETLVNINNFALGREGRARESAVLFIFEC